MDLDVDKHKAPAYRGIVSISAEISASHPASSQQWDSIKDSNRLLASLLSKVDKAAESDEHIHKPPRPLSEGIQDLLDV